MHLYIHIPFCISKCAYCDFNSYPINQFESDIVDTYIDAVTKEIQSARKRISKKHVNLKTIYIGGGTPSILNEIHIKKIIFAIRENFGLTGTLEFTIECNPESLTRDSLRYYKGMGINRISLGVQSFYDDLLSLIDRSGGSKEITRSIESVKKEGFRNFSFDLIFALPHQTLDMFHKDLEKAVSFAPPHISLYCLTLHSDLECKFKNKNLLLPGESEQIKMYKHGVRFLEENGYHRYEISNFAKGSYESRHNLSYWHHKEYIGIGAGASSYLEGYRTKNETGVQKYIDSIRKTGSSYIEKNEISTKEAKSEFVFLSLRLNGGLDLEKYRDRFHSDFLSDFSGFLDKWDSKNLFTINDSKMTLTENGILLSDELFRDLF